MGSIFFADYSLPVWGLQARFRSRFCKFGIFAWEKPAICTKNYYYRGRMFGRPAADPPGSGLDWSRLQVNTQSGEGTIPGWTQSISSRTLGVLTGGTVQHLTCTLYNQNSLHLVPCLGKCDSYEPVSLWNLLLYFSEHPVKPFGMPWLWKHTRPLRWWVPVIPLSFP